MVGDSVTNVASPGELVVATLAMVFSRLKGGPLPHRCETRTESSTSGSACIGRKFGVNGSNVATRWRLSSSAGTTLARKLLIFARGTAGETKIRNHYLSFRLSDTFRGRWIFDCTSLSSSVRMLRGQLTYSTKNRMRAHMRAHRCSSRVSSSPVNSWLFLRGERAQARALRQLIDRDGVASKRRRIRSGKEYEDFERWENEHDLASIWLFLPSRVGLQMLQNMKSSLRRRYQRRGYDEHLVEDPGIDNFIHSGAWLFHCVARDETIAHLHRLHEHSRNGYDVADDREYAHWIQIDEYGSPSKMDEYNLGNILALFSE